MMNLIYGVGLNDRRYPSTINGKHTEPYIVWVNMLRRCYDQKSFAYRPTYKGCTVSDNFKNFSYFYEWCHAQPFFGLDTYQLDKDIICRNNKVYSENVCVFVPHEINSFFETSGASRGDYPVGVSFDKARGKYEAYCRAYGKKQSLGRFTSPQEAYSVYKTFKESRCRDMANKWRGQIDNRVYDAMMAWRVEQ